MQFKSTAIRSQYTAKPWETAGMHLTRLAPAEATGRSWQYSQYQAKVFSLSVPKSSTLHLGSANAGHRRIIGTIYAEAPDLALSLRRSQRAQDLTGVISSRGTRVRCINTFS
ncbi:hypothetical protein EVAR_10805_1 [Eumeta japonica]|uniref:Uncharacterized protein n=1 Tax=Eumeta variegata TaxID=151549 RepID=A0A4C1Y9P1_EUMVA|nr:hypothetical protein EVAR_10805_1 [Eumeta japonica]